jgi:hypothetical protein
LPPYNGGLFDPKAAPLLDRVELPDAAFAPLLDALSRHGGRRINYRDLSVQQLGSIYERLLEYEVVEKEGKVEVVADEAARKGSGSFYTHEVLVQFILERTVGPLVTERIERFRETAEALASEHRPKADRLAQLISLDPASKLLEIKVCDPAMGSGHFLVSLVDFLADRVLEAVAAAPRLVRFADDQRPYESPVVERIAAIRERILRLAQQSRWRLDEAQLDDKHLVRRMILKRVVHGVDKNPMAVELAKVALWLHTFTAGAPLSFLDHHLLAATACSASASPISAPGYRSAVPFRFTVTSLPRSTRLPAWRRWRGSPTAISPRSRKVRTRSKACARRPSHSQPFCPWLPPSA